DIGPVKIKIGLIFIVFFIDDTSCKISNLSLPSLYHAVISFVISFPGIKKAVNPNCFICKEL
ncbi:hypothetical protein, partial [Faecalimonas hominis]